MHDASAFSIGLRYVIGGILVSIYLHALVSGGAYPAIVWLYGLEMAPLTLAFPVAPALLGAPGAILAWRMDLRWRIAFAMLSAAVLGLAGLLWINGGDMRDETFVFVPLASVASLAGCLVDWMMTRRERLARLPRWTRTAAECAFAFSLVLIVVGMANTFADPPELLWP